MFYLHRTLCQFSEVEVNVSFDLDAHDQFAALDFFFKENASSSWILAAKELKQRVLNQSVNIVYQPHLAKVDDHKAPYQMLIHALKFSLTEFLYTQEVHQTDPQGEALCLCAGVTKQQVLNHIHQLGAVSLDELSERLNVASGCMKCLDSIVELLPISEKRFLQRRRWHFLGKDQVEWMDDILALCQEQLTPDIKWQITSLEYANVTVEIGKKVKNHDQLQQRLQQMLTERYEHAPAISFRLVDTQDFD